MKDFLRGCGTVRFDQASGVLWPGYTCLAGQLDRYESYANLKHSVPAHSGGTDTTDGASFCQKLKRRIKPRWVPKIDWLIATTNKGDGYRLRGYVER